jgi:hypothetical protein
MDPNAIVNLALIALNGILSLIGTIRGQGGVSDDVIAAQVQTITKGNDDAYDSMIAALKLIPPAPKA